MPTGTIQTRFDTWSAKQLIQMSLAKEANMMAIPTVSIFNYNSASCTRLATVYKDSQRTTEGTRGDIDRHFQNKWSHKFMVLICGAPHKRHCAIQGTHWFALKPEPVGWDQRVSRRQPTRATRVRQNRLFVLFLLLDKLNILFHLSCFLFTFLSWYSSHFSSSD